MPYIYPSIDSKAPLPDKYVDQQVYVGKIGIATWLFIVDWERITVPVID